MANYGHHPPPGREPYPPNPEWNVPPQGEQAPPRSGNTLPYTIAAPGGDPGLAPGGPAQPPGAQAAGMPPYGMPPQGRPPYGPPPRPPQGPPPGPPPNAPYPPPPQGPHPQAHPQPHPQPPVPPGPPAGGPPPPPPGRRPPYPPPRTPQPPPGPVGPPPRPPAPYPPAAHPLGAPGHAARRGGAGPGAAIGGFLGVLAGVFVLLVIAVNAVGDDDDVEPVSALPTPTFTLPSISPYRTPTFDRERTAEATRDATDEAAEDVGRPEQTRTANRSLRDNSLYTAGRLPSVNCPAGSVSIYNHTQLKNLILRTGQCMNRAWAPVLERAGFDHRPPGYAIAAVRGRGACGDYPPRGSIVPYYCPRNTTIYASTSAMARGSGNAIGYGQLTSWHGAIISMMAHEYGHHVQYLTGLTDGWWRQTLESSSESAKLALSRRLELQATCFGGMWMRSVTSSYPVPTARRNLLFAFYSRVGDHPGYPRDHGSPANNHRWFRFGYEFNQTQRCNTWRASASTVS